MQVDFSPAARNDLLEIALYINRDNAKRALSFITEIESKCFKLAKSPNIGSTRADLGDNIRMLVHGRYLIFYSAKPQLVLIERILHSARDISVADINETKSNEDTNQWLNTYPTTIPTTSSSCVIA